MLNHCLATALRGVARHKLHSLISIAGLAVGLACAIFILLFVRDELSWDRWIPGSETLYRVTSTFHMPGEADNFLTLTPFPVTATMQADFPEVVAQTHIIPHTMTARIGDRNFPVTVDSVDANFLQVIQLPMVSGNPATALAKPESLLLSQAMARRFFGAADPMGKTVTLSGTHRLVVTGILRDLPHNTHLAIDLVMPNTSQADPSPPQTQTSWLNVQGWIPAGWPASSRRCWTRISMSRSAWA
jgi:putative ABC transport system permease protein